MRISDWSSDVCSSDLLPSLHGDVVARIAGPIARPVAEVHACRPRADRQPLFERAAPLGPIVEQRFVAIAECGEITFAGQPRFGFGIGLLIALEPAFDIGRTEWRGDGWKEVEI